MNNKFYAVMVICNRDIDDSISFKSLKRFDFVNIIVCDNSTETNGNSRCEGANVRYIDMGGNSGLAKAYNRAIDLIGASDGVICLFDDDTSVPEDYFEKIDAFLRENDADIVLPTVYDEVGIMSPCKINGVLTSRVADTGELDGESISAINSGMAVKSRVFSDYRYNEEYFLDFIDHAFIRDMKALSKSIKICPALELKQSFSANDRDVKRARARFEIFKRDYSLFCKGSGSVKDRLLGRLYLLKRSFNINILYRLGR